MLAITLGIYTARAQVSNQVILNRYASVVSMDPCNNVFIVDTATGFNVGDTVLIIQMKGAQIDTSNTASFGTITDYKSAGNYEINIISARTGNNITLQYALDRTYDIPDGKVQLVRVPYYQNYTVSQPHTCLPWNGSKGGIFAIHVAGTLTLSDDIDVSGKGFRGGERSIDYYITGRCSEMDYYYTATSGMGGQKGEGIAIPSVNQTHGRGPLANGGGGGNSVNAGGAGGGNFGAGGRGGDQWDVRCPRSPIGGDRALSLMYSNIQNRVFLGGGGGGGQQNNSASTPGVNGGGIMIIQASTIISNNKKIMANGADNLVLGGPDGAGGGGGGGSILFSAGSISGTAVLELKGGKGGSINAIECHGAGGGGGGGILWTNTTLPGTWSTDLSGGAAGTGTCGTGSHGAAAGNPGGTLTGLSIPKSTTPFSAPIVKPHLAVNSPLCAGDTIKLGVTNTYSGLLVYSWTGPAAYSSNQRDPVIPNAASAHAGLYTLTVSVANCKLSDTIRVIVRDNPGVNLGNDTGICQSSVPFLLQSPQPAGTLYLWSDASAGPQLSVDSTGKYWLRVTDPGGCTGSDTISLKVIADPVVSLGADTIICEETLLHIGGAVAGAGYQWNTGNNTSHINVSASGTYIVQVNLEGCIVSDTIVVTVMPAPDIDLGGDRYICPEQEIHLDAASGTGSRYLWNTGATTSAIPVFSAGLYWVQVTSEHHCTGRDSILLTARPLPSVSLGADTTFCEGSPVPLVLSVWQANADSIIWQDGNNEFTRIIPHSGEYIVTAVNDCGVANDTIFIRSLYCDIWLPNAFTPDGDGINDVFRVLGSLNRISDFEFLVFNRWGRIVFRTTDKGTGWDGRLNGTDQLLGTYSYLLKYKIGENLYSQKGNFHLIR